jgi:hypothetical protein
MPPPEPLHEAIVFNPHWFADPPPWWVERLPEEQQVAVANIQLQLVIDQLGASLKAAEAIKGVVGAGQR